MSCEICVNHVPFQGTSVFVTPRGATFGRAEHAKAPHICELDGYYERQVVARL